VKSRSANCLTRTDRQTDGTILYPPPQQGVLQILATPTKIFLTSKTFLSVYLEISFLGEVLSYPLLQGSWLSGKSPSCCPVCTPSVVRLTPPPSALVFPNDQCAWLAISGSRGPRQPGSLAINLQQPRRIFALPDIPRILNWSSFKTYFLFLCNKNITYIRV
jgi:hypothetical protein